MWAGSPRSGNCAHSIIEWALGRYRVAALGAVYFSGALEPPEQRREAIEVLIDAATANLLGGLLTDETRSTLLARLDVSLDGPLVGHDVEATPAAGVGFRR